MYCVSASPSSRVCATFSTLQSPLCDGRFDAGAASGLKAIVQGETGTSTPALGMELGKTCNWGPLGAPLFPRDSAWRGSQKRNLARRRAWDGVYILNSNM